MSLDEFRARYQAATGLSAPDEAFSFGDSPAMAGELAGLVLGGRKRATAALRADLRHRGQAMPVPGDREIVLDGVGRPVCVLETTWVEVAPFASVDEAFAWDEGEGDRSLEYWVAAHRRFFERRCAELGIEFDEGIAVVFERFEVVWQPDGA